MASLVVGDTAAKFTIRHAPGADVRFALNLADPEGAEASLPAGAVVEIVIDGLPAALPGLVAAGRVDWSVESAGFDGLPEVAPAAVWYRYAGFDTRWFAGYYTRVTGADSSAQMSAPVVVSPDGVQLVTVALSAGIPGPPDTAGIAAHAAAADPHSAYLTATAANAAYDVAGAAAKALTAGMLGPRFFCLGNVGAERYESWNWLAVLRSNWRLAMPQFMTGVPTGSSYTSRQALAWYEQLLSPIKPDFVALMFGSDDFWDSVTANRLTLAEFRTNITTICDRLVQLNIRPVICTSPPRRPTDTQYSFVTMLASANSWLRTFAATRTYPLVDFYAAVVDVTTGTLKPEYDTPSPIAVNAGAVLADRFIAGLDHFLLPASVPGPALVNDPNSVLLNPGLTDTNADGTPDNWTVEPSGAGLFTPSVVTDSRFTYGKAIQLAVGSGGSAARLTSANMNVGAANFSPGDTIRVCLEYTIESSTGLSIVPEIAGFGAHIRLPSEFQFFAYHSQPAPAGQVHKFTGLAYCPVTPLTGQAGSFTLNTVALVLKVNTPAGGTLTVRVGSMSVTNVKRKDELIDGKGVGTYLWINTPNPAPTPAYLYPIGS